MGGGSACQPLAHPAHVLLCAELADVLPIDPERRAHLEQAVINARVREIGRVFQLLQRQIRCDDQGLAGAVAPVHDVEHLRHGEFRTVLHAEIVKDQKAVGVQALQEVAALAGVDPHELIQQRARPGEQHRDAAIEQVVRDARGEEGLPRADVAPEQQPRAGFEHLRKLLGVGAQLRALRLIAEVVFKRAPRERGVPQAVRFQLADLRHARTPLCLRLLAVPRLGLARAETFDNLLCPEEDQPSLPYSSAALAADLSVLQNLVVP